MHPIFTFLYIVQGCIVMMKIFDLEIFADVHVLKSPDTEKVFFYMSMSVCVCVCVCDHDSGQTAIGINSKFCIYRYNLSLEI